jgi:hypothetical protein
MQLIYSHNDHYKWGFNDDWFNPAQGDGFFQVSLGACSRPHLSFRQECINAAKLLGEKFTKPILVGLSGGSDSQVVCLSLMEAGVPFRPVILKLLDPKGKLYNGHDIRGAFDFCKKFNLDPIIEELDLDNFFVTTGMQLIHDYCITVAEITVQLYLVDKYKDTHAYINGGGDPVLSYSVDDETGESCLTYSLMPTPIQQYMIVHGIEGCLKFFMYTPEQIAAYIDHPVMHYYNRARDSINGSSNLDYFTFCIKPMMYATEWPEVVQRRKQTGFERVPYFKEVRLCTELLNTHINPRSKKVIWKYKEILEHLNSNTGEIKTWKSIDDRNIY